MTASERIRAAREALTSSQVESDMERYGHIATWRNRKNGAKLAKYGPAYCDCLRCRIIRYTQD